MAVRDNVKFYYANYPNMRAGDTVYYHQTIDIPMPNMGWAVTNDLDLLTLRVLEEALLASWAPLSGEERALLRDLCVWVAPFDHDAVRVLRRTA